MRFATILTLAGVLCFMPAAAAECQTGCDRTLSPYFLIPDGKPELDWLPLESTSVEIRIAAVFAQVTVRQVYKNTGERTLEAVYVFPASTRAAVHGMKMKIGERTLVAEIREREEARRDYEDAKQEGRSAGLLEQNRPNVFQMNVANILPGDRIEVELAYSELLEPTGGVYEFVYPTVVGPRYSKTDRKAATDRETWVESPYLLPGGESPYRFDLSAQVSAGMPIKDLECPSHDVDLRFIGTEEATLRLRPSESQGGNRDFILRYRLRGDQVFTGLLLEEGSDEDYFLLMLQPPDRVPPTAFPPREYIFVIDVSGSMDGFPHATCQQLLRKLIGDLRPSDYFNVLFFSGDSFLLGESSLPATSENVSFALKAVESRQTGGGTNLLPALRRALALPAAEETVARSVLVLTDGYVDVERETFRLIRENLGQANVFAFGVGGAVNRYLIEGIARAGWGQPFVATDPKQARAAAEQFWQYVSAPVLTDVEARAAGFEAQDLEPPRMPDLFLDRPLVLLGKSPQGSRRSGKIAVEGLAARGAWSGDLSLQTATRVPSGLISRLWARQRLSRLADYGDLEDAATRRQVTELGLRHQILTELTSFVAIDTVIRAATGETVRVVQPLPLPESLSSSAVGGGGAGGHALALSAGYGAGRAKTITSRGSGKGIVGGVPAAPPPRRQQPAPSPQNSRKLIRASGNVVASRLLQRVEPVYPELALQARVQGIVLLLVKIDEEGNVVEVELVRGHPLLNEAAIEAVKQWKYDPVRLDGEPVAVLAPVTVAFHLN